MNFSTFDNLDGAPPSKERKYKDGYNGYRLSRDRVSKLLQEIIFVKFENRSKISTNREWIDIVMA